MLNGFDSIARVYDTLAFLVFGKHIRQSQVAFLEEIPARAKIVVLGGGSGWFLKRLLAAKPDCQVWYIEASGKMITLSAQRINRDTRVHFIHGTESDIPRDLLFDVVVTHFYLDLFPASQLKNVVSTIKMGCAPSVKWFVSDFINTDVWWHKLLLRTMYLFFGQFSHIKARKLEEWEMVLKEKGFELVDSKSFYNGFIKSAVFAEKRA